MATVIVGGGGPMQRKGASPLYPHQGKKFDGHHADIQRMRKKSGIATFRMEPEKGG